MQLAGWLSAPKLLGIKVNGCHLVPVISRTKVLTADVSGRCAGVSRGGQSHTTSRAAWCQSMTISLRSGRDICPADREHPQRQQAEAERDHLAGEVAELLAGDVLWDTPMIW